MRTEDRMYIGMTSNTVKVFQSAHSSLQQHAFPTSAGKTIATRFGESGLGVQDGTTANGR